MTAGLDRRSLIAAAVATGAAPAARAAAPPWAPRTAPAQRTWAPPPPPPRLKRGATDVGGVRLAWLDTGGAGETVVLMHPATGSLDVWAYQLPALVQAGFRVIAWSRRGHLGSERGPDAATGFVVEDLDRLMDALEVGRFHLVGSAAGGFSVPDYALYRPQRLASAVIACSQAGANDPAYRAAIARLPPPAFTALAAELRELGPSYRAANPDGVSAWTELEHRSLVGERVRQPSKARLDWADFARIRTPTLVIAGDADMLAPVPLMLEVARRIPGAEAAILSESGHSGYWEQPIAFNRLVIDFLRRHPARGRRAD